MSTDASSGIWSREDSQGQIEDTPNQADLNILSLQFRISTIHKDITSFEHLKKILHKTFNERNINPTS